MLVGVHTDEDVTERRGPHLPIMALHERALSVLSCRYVDEVVIGERGTVGVPRGYHAPTWRAWWAGGGGRQPSTRDCCWREGVTALVLACCRQERARAAAQLPLGLRLEALLQRLRSQSACQPAAARSEKEHSIRWPALSPQQHPEVPPALPPAGAPTEITEDLLTTFNISLVVTGSVHETAGRTEEESARYAVPRERGIFK